MEANRFDGVLVRSLRCKGVRPALIDREPRRPSTAAIQRLAGCMKDPPWLGKGRRRTKVSRCNIMHALWMQANKGDCALP